VPDLKADSPAAAWYAVYLFHKKIHGVNFFVNKDRESSTLPETISATKPGIA